MPSPAEFETDPEWLADDTEIEVEMSDDDEFEFEDMDDGDDAAEETVQPAHSATNVPVWRLIEMSREDRFLQRELADFEDYDNYDRFADDPVGLSH
ncbi:MAG TPA: hypothetical protein VFE85_02840 [Woeseiaceae bacterium]|nr:hypothetical protein [Woeseiaceae bacterium]